MRADFPNVSLFDRGTVSSSRPVVATASRADAVKDGRRSAAASHSAVARPRLDGGEHDAILHDRRDPFPTQPALMVRTVFRTAYFPGPNRGPELPPAPPPLL